MRHSEGTLNVSNSTALLPQLGFAWASYPFAKPAGSHADSLAPEGLNSQIPVPSLALGYTFKASLLRFCAWDERRDEATVVDSRTTSSGCMITCSG